jgi:DNA mismatch repair protein MutS
MSARDTPVMRQHAEAKQEYPNALIFFRLGDFYELFGQDAVIAAPILDLVLTSRNKGAKDEIPMAGVPHHAAHGYIGRLLDAGYNVALCEQMADPSKCKGIVPRQVVRVITPGLVTDRDQLDAASNNWLATIDAEPSSIGLSLLDLSTGELLSASMPNAATLLAELARVSPRECHFFGLDSHLDIGDFTKTFRAALPRASLQQDSDLTPSEVDLALNQVTYDVESLILVERRSAARAIRLARRCNVGKPLPIYRVTRLNLDINLAIDEVTQTHLELVQSRDGSKTTTLLATLDATKTPAGARLLRRRLLAPLRDVFQIRRRLDAVEAFVVNSRIRSLFRDALSRVGDLERIASRAVLGEATPRDLGALRQGLDAAHEIASHLHSLADPSFHEALDLPSEPLDTVSDVALVLTNALVDNPPALSKEGAIFRSSYDEELKEYDQLKRTGAERIAEMESLLRESTGVSTLKIRFTRVFGWYIEVSRGQAAKVPTAWRRKQTIATGERFTTVDLEDLADKISHAEERHRERELELFRTLLDLVTASALRIQALSARLSQWDVAAALAEVAHRHDYCRPSVDDSDIIQISDGRHPVVERMATQGRFVPNDCTLDLNAERLWLITGPNMAGKSTFLRQVALVAIMAQMGSYVPAREARIGTVDRILSRVGASDNLARGESTFMVEMRETSRILHSATRRSLVILDEIGRGTSTYDGLAIAWSVAEYLDEVIGCRALFATHYHELTRLADVLEHAANHNVTAKEVNDDVVFLYRLAEGAASRSYGVAVAKLAALPEAVLARAKDVLHQLESQSADILNLTPSLSNRADATRQLDLFQSSPQNPVERKILDSLRELEVERLTPLEALALLDRWKRTLRG